MAAPERKVLLLAPEFPPACGGGVQRTLKFVHYLPEFGWTCAVLTRDPEAEGERLLDREMAAEAGGARVERVAHRNPFAWLERWAQRRLRGGPGRRFLLRALGYLWDPLPKDPYVWWTRRARRAARRLVEEERPDAIYTSGPPHSAHLLGLRLKRRTGLPLVCDFRDAWSARPIWRGRRASLALECLLERRVLRCADRIVCNNEAMREDFARIEPACALRCVVIENGFDPADFEGLPPAGAPRAQGPVRLAHVGFVRAGAAGPVLRALAALREAEPDTAAGLRVTFVSGLGPEDAGLLLTLDLGAAVEMGPRVTHREAVGAMHKADVLLLLLKNAPAWGPVHTGKLYEYMASGRPVLAVAPEGLAAALVRESGTGLAVRPDDAEGLLNALRLAAEGPEAFRRKHYAPRPEVIARYERRRLTERLARVFDALVAGGRS